jgi:outer membrane autotransporter protein
VALAEDVRLGFAAGYDIISLGTGTGASAEGERTNLGAVAKYNPGPWLFSAAVAGGWGDYDTTRNMAFGGFAGQATGDSDVDYLQGRLHAAYLIQQAAWYAKPLIDATLTELDFDGGTETGGGGAALIVASDSDTYWAISPALEVGSEYRLSALSVLRPFLRGGVTWRDGDNVDLRAGFAAAPAGIGAFTINTAVDDVLADVAAGIDVINAKGAVLRLQYDGRFGEETQQNSASIKGSVPF